MSDIITYPSLHRVIENSCSQEEKDAFMDFKIQNDLIHGFKIKGDPKEIGNQISAWLKTHAKGRAAYITLANMVMDYFYHLRTLILNHRGNKLEII
nr:MAG TPA: hypothetical protein [Caudoviricetes sp.]